MTFLSVLHQLIVHLCVKNVILYAASSSATFNMSTQLLCHVSLSRVVVSEVGTSSLLFLLVLAAEVFLTSTATVESMDALGFMSDFDFSKSFPLKMAPSHFRAAIELKSIGTLIGRNRGI